MAAMAHYSRVLEVVIDGPPDFMIREAGIRATEAERVPTSTRRSPLGQLPSCGSPYIREPEETKAF